MVDIEKVIKEFEHLLNDAKGNYQDFVDLTIDAGEEILALDARGHLRIFFSKIIFLIFICGYINSVNNFIMLSKGHSYLFK